MALGRHNRQVTLRPTQGGSHHVYYITSGPTPTDWTITTSNGEPIGRQGSIPACLEQLQHRHPGHVARVVKLV